jgi:hypothetical protein
MTKREVLARRVYVAGVRYFEVPLLWKHTYFANMRVVVVTVLVLLKAGLFAQSYEHWSSVAPSGELDAVNSKFGWAIAESGERVVIGAPFYDDYYGRVTIVQDEAIGSPATMVHVSDSYNSNASSPAAQRFGASTAISGDWLAVGNYSPFGGDLYIGSSAVWVTLFHFEGSSWQAHRRFRRPSGAPGGNFGKAIALSDDLLVIGGGRIANGPEGRNVVYMYRRVGAEWSTAPLDSLFGDINVSGDTVAFGHALSMDGDLLVIGAPGDDELGTDCGAAFLYGRDYGGDENWGLVRKLLPSNGMAGDHFGRSVTIKDGRCLVGAPGRSVNGTQAGGAYLYEENAGLPGNWGEVAYLEPIGDLGAYMSFGDAVALGPDRVAIGAPKHQLNGSGYDGSVHVYGKDGEVWNAIQRIVPQQEGLVSVASRSGNSLAFSGNKLLIGAPWARLLGQTPMAEITGAVFVYAEGPVFVSSHDRSDLRLYPNPCTERVHIRAETDNLVRIRMVDSVGREVRPWEITTGNTFSWNVVDVEPGSYIVQCELASGKRVTLPLARQ